MDNYSARSLVKKALEPTIPRPCRLAAEVRAELKLVQVEQELIRERILDLQAELGQAAAQQTPPHPLHGKKVRRRVRSYRWSDWRVQHGTMQQNTGATALHAGTGAFRERVAPGGYYVRTLSGRGAYDVHVGERCEPWELDE